MDRSDLAFAGAARQAELIRAGEVSSRELTELYLERIEGPGRQLNAFRTVWGERALAEADAADARRANGDEAPLLGVPLAIKDEMSRVAGDVTTLGTAGFDQPADADSVMVARLREAGAVLVGKTNLPELAICGFTESKTYGVTRNPWDPGRTPGGSSGGSAAAVAAGLVAIASASDGAGSIRIPAANCGLFGLKPQPGRVPAAPDIGHWRGLSALGCVSRTVGDTALFLDVTGAAGGDPGAPPPPQRPFAEAAVTSPAKLRIAISDRPMRAIAPAIVGDQAKAALVDTERLLAGLGHAVHREDPRFGSAGNNLSSRYLKGISDDVHDVPHPERLERRTRGFGRLGSLVPERMARAAQRAAVADAERINAIFERCDVLITPTVGTQPVEVGRWAGKGALRTVLGMSRVYCFTPVWNHTGQPAASVPAGFDADGLPLSVQLIGRPADEATLISLAAQIEAERPWADRRPPIG